MRLVEYTKVFGFWNTMGNVAQKAAPLTAIAGLASAGITLSKQLQSTKFQVIYKTPTGVGRQVVSANTPIDAMNKARKSAINNSQMKAFRLPEQEQLAAEYYESLKSN